MAKIIARVYKNVHLYYELIDDEGNRIAQVNGLSFDRKTQEFIPIGLPLNLNDSIIARVDNYGYLAGTSDVDLGAYVEVYSGPVSKVYEVKYYLEEFMRYVNVQDLNYTPVPPPIDNGTYNSNSVFMGVTSVIEAVTNTSYRNNPPFKAYTDSPATQGTFSDIFQGNSWSPNFVDGVIVGSHITNLNGDTYISGTGGHDVIEGYNPSIISSVYGYTYEGEAEMIPMFLVVGRVLVVLLMSLKDQVPTG